MAVALCFVFAGCTRHAETNKRLIVLGIDGMDPEFLERHWDALPELDRLRREGEFKRLATTTPPQSPVAWSTFITGTNPGEHGVFDFIHRDPDTLLPVSSMAQASEGGVQLTIGPYVLPVTRGQIRNSRQGTPFWKSLADRGVPVTILRMPTDFPPEECEGHSLAGMGTPDLRGTFGTFSFFTTDPQWKNRKVSGGDVIPVELGNYQTLLRLPGPDNSLRRDNQRTHVDIRVAVDPAESVARFEIGSERVILKQGEWSDWIPVQFGLIPPLATANGMIRIYLKQVRPHFAAYISPVNIDPIDPVMRISEPDSYSSELASAKGRFHTQGMPHATGALRYGVLSREEYLKQSRGVSEQALKLLDYGIDRFRTGLLFFHFFGIDQDSHMLWGDYETELLHTYRMVDDAIGRIREKAAGATIVIMSDHGFAPFDREVHLNTWLMREKFLALQDPDAPDNEALKNVDWSRTKAYALGLNGIYVNQQFREREGIVGEGEEYEVLVAGIRKRLLELRDPVSGRPVVHRVAIAREEYRGAMVDGAPDLIVGYYPGYRSSWQTALGAVPSSIIEDNTDEWRGDHCISAEFVPGVLLSNRKSARTHPRLQDLTATIMEEFGAGNMEQLEGRSIYSTERLAHANVQADYQAR